MFLGGDGPGPLVGHAAAAGELGPLERRVLEALRARAAGATVHDICPEFPSIAYTTLSTTLERLRRKGLLERSKSGRAFAYRHRYTRAELASLLVRHALAGLGEVAAPDVLPPILSLFLDSVSGSDEAALDELERLILERRKGIRPGGDEP